MKTLSRSKLFWSAIFVLVLIRIAMTFVLLDRLNKFLADFSPIYSGHVGDLRISVWRGAYRFSDFDLRLKKDGDEKFVVGKVVDVSLAWRELFQGRITTDIKITGLDVSLTQKVIDTIRAAPKKSEEDTHKAGKKLFPVRVERIELRESSFEFAELLSIPDWNRWRITQIDGRISNATPNEGTPIMFLTANGALFDNAKIKLVLQMNQLVSPPAWDADLELRAFQLKDANAWLKRKMPLTFTSGALDLFAEARSLPGGFEGYVKPFIKKADIVAGNETFSGLRQFGIEVSLATINLILRTSKDKVLATKILFARENGEFKLNSTRAISEALKNGFSDPLPEGIDDEISLSNINSTEVKK